MPRFLRAPSRLDGERLLTSWQLLGLERGQHSAALQVGSLAAHWCVYQERFDDARQIAEDLQLLAKRTFKGGCNPRDLIMAYRAIAYIPRHVRHLDLRESLCYSRQAQRLSRDRGLTADQVAMLREELKACAALYVRSEGSDRASLRNRCLKVRSELLAVGGDQTPHEGLEAEWLHTCAVLVESMFAIGENRWACADWERMYHYDGKKQLTHNNPQLASKYHFAQVTAHCAWGGIREARMLIRDCLERRYMDVFHNRRSRLHYIERSITARDAVGVQKAAVLSLACC